jgi:hypothetical protein
LSKLDHGDQALVGVDLYGLNFSVRKELAVGVGGFNPALGRCGRSLRSGEESDLQKRICAAGNIAVYEPRAVVGHVVSKERLTKKWFLRRAFAPGADLEALRTSQVAIHLVRCCGSACRSLLRREGPDVLFGKTLVSVAVFRHLYECLRRPWRLRSET